MLGIKCIERMKNMYLIINKVSQKLRKFLNIYFEINKYKNTRDTFLWNNI